MLKKKIPLAHLPRNHRAAIVKIYGGHGLQRRLRVMGVREGQIVKVVSRQPLMGPLTINIGSCQMTMGRGMAHKIIVEVL